MEIEFDLKPYKLLKSLTYRQSCHCPLNSNDHPHLKVLVYDTDSMEADYYGDVKQFLLDLMK